jgi:hypothetical protein
VTKWIPWGGHVEHQGDKKKCIQGVVGKPEGKGPLGTPRPNWEGNSKMDLKRKRMGECGMD